MDFYIPSLPPPPPLIPRKLCKTSIWHALPTMCMRNVRAQLKVVIIIKEKIAFCCPYYGHLAGSNRFIVSVSAH